MVLYQVPPGSPLIAVNVGASAPLIIKALAANAPAKELPSPAFLSAGVVVGSVTPVRRGATGSAPNVQPNLLSFLAGR